MNVQPPRQGSAKGQVRQKPQSASTVRVRVKASSGAFSQMSARGRSRRRPPTYAFVWSDGQPFTAPSDSMPSTNRPA